MKPWIPFEVNGWPEIVEMLTDSGRSWPEAAVTADLRWHVDQGVPLPGRDKLMERWRWPDWSVRELLRKPALWWDPTKGPPPESRAELEALVPVRRRSRRVSPPGTTREPTRNHPGTNQVPVGQTPRKRKKSPGTTQEPPDNHPGNLHAGALDPPSPAPSPPPGNTQQAEGVSDASIEEIEGSSPDSSTSRSASEQADREGVVESPPHPATSGHDESRAETPIPDTLSPKADPDSSTKIGVSGRDSGGTTGGGPRPAWAPRNFGDRAIEAVRAAICEVRQAGSDPATEGADADAILRFSKKLGLPVREFLPLLLLLAAWAREAPDAAGPIRGVGWNAPDRSRDLGTLLQADKWGDRLTSARRWREARSRASEPLYTPDPPPPPPPLPEVQPPRTSPALVARWTEALVVLRRTLGSATVETWLSGGVLLSPSCLWLPEFHREFVAEEYLPAVQAALGVERVELVSGDDVLAGPGARRVA